MKWFPLLLTLLLLITFPVLAQQTGKQIYKTYCAGCHGADLQGNSASGLVKTEWAYGGDRNSIEQNIRDGIEDTEMSAFRNVISNEEIDAVVDYILNAQEEPITENKAIPTTIKTEEYTLTVDIVVENGITTPWGITFIDENLAFFTERKGNIRRLVDGHLDPKQVKDVPPTQELRTGGYMDIIADPNYDENGWLYLAYSYTPFDLENDSARAMTKVVRGRIENHRWTDQQTLFSVPDSLLVRKGNRWGSRFLFDEEGYLYFSIGDMARGEASQDPGKPMGKVFRIHPDGSIPDDNPYTDTPGALEAIYSIGNRNVQGIDQHPVTGDIWATEHGPMGGDELNILINGANYGWPVITYGVDYDGSIVSEKTHQEGMEQPVVQWTPSIAVCPAQFSTSPMFPKWENDLLVGALKFEELRRLVIENNEVIKQEILFKDYGRVRDIQTGPNGNLYVLLNSPDAIILITPQNP